jgi:hypothetical protein
MVRAWEPRVDRPYVLATWFHALRGILGFRLRREADTWSRAIERTADVGLVLVASPVDSPSTILGWAAWSSSDHLAFVYVPRALRGHGICRALLAASENS